MILGRHDVAQPDILVVTNPSQISGRGIEGAPLLVVEVLSPSTRRHDREVKMRRYAALAIPHYWIVDPEGKWIACYRLAGDSYRQLLSTMATSNSCPRTGRTSPSLSPTSGADRADAEATSVPHAPRSDAVGERG